jgi:hypothetical protein
MQHWKAGNGFGDEANGEISMLPSPWSSIYINPYLWFSASTIQCRLSAVLDSRSSSDLVTRGSTSPSVRSGWYSFLSLERLVSDVQCRMSWGSRPFAWGSNSGPLGEWERGTKESSNGFTSVKSPDTRKGFDNRRWERVGLESGVASVTESSTIFGARSTRKLLSSSSLVLGTGMGLEGSLGLGGAGGWGCSLVSSDLDDVERSGSKSSKRLSHPMYYVSVVCAGGRTLWNWKNGLLKGNSFTL